MKGMDADIELDVKINFIAADPFFYGTALEHSEEDISSSLEFEVENDGTRNALPTIHITVTSGSLYDLTISSGNYLIEIDSIFEADDEIIIDCKNFTVEAREQYGEWESIITLVGDDFLVSGFEIIPEPVDVTVSASGTFTLDVVLNYRNTWL